MGFQLEPTDEQRALTETVHHFAASVVRPAARDCEAAKQVPASLWRQLHEMGVAAPVAEQFGGGGTLDAVTFCIVAEELAWGDPGIAYQVLGSGLAAALIAAAGTDAQRSRHLPSFAESDPIPTFVAVGEKVAAGDLAALETTIDGDVVVGRKYGVLNATDGALGIVVGRSGDGLGAVVVAPDAVEIVKPEDKLGLEAAPTAVVDFDAAGEALPAGERLDRAILWTKLLTGAIAVGCARASLEYASQYATEREAFGKPIGAFQGVAFKIADMAIAVDAARVELWRAAWAVDTGTPTPDEVAQAVAHTLAAAVRCGDDAVQVLGGHGYMRDHPVEKWFRDAVTLTAFDSPDLVADAAVGRVALAG